MSKKVEDIKLNMTSGRIAPVLMIARRA